MKKVLFAVAAVALLAVTAGAGEIKIHEWPCQFVPQEVTTIPVVMDVGYWIKVKDQDKLRIKLTQKTIHSYEGCVDVVIETNTNITVSAKITSTGAVPGDYSVKVNGGGSAPVDAPGGTVTICAYLEKADLSKTPGGSKDVHVATVSVRVVPR
jgi:hypothetical protein